MKAHEAPAGPRLGISCTRSLSPETTPQGICYFTQRKTNLSKAAGLTQRQFPVIFSAFIVQLLVALVNMTPQRQTLASLPSCKLPCMTRLHTRGPHTHTRGQRTGAGVQREWVGSPSDSHVALEPSRSPSLSLGHRNCPPRGLAVKVR